MFLYQILINLLKDGKTSYQMSLHPLVYSKTAETFVAVRAEKQAQRLTMTTFRMRKEPDGTAISYLASSCSFCRKRLILR